MNDSSASAASSIGGPHSPVSGVLLVVNSGVGGMRLVMRYPPVMRRQVTSETLRAFAYTRGSGQATSADSQISKWYANVYDMPSVYLAPLVGPSSVQLDKPLEISVDGGLFLAYPRGIISSNSHSDLGTSGESAHEESIDSVSVSSEATSATPEKIKLRSFVLCVVCDTHLPVDILESLRRIIEHVSSVYLREEQLCGYLTQQSNILFGLREEWLDAQVNPKDDHKPTHDELAQQMLNNSSLAKELCTIYTSLKKGGQCHLRINNWINLSLSLRHTNSYPSFPIRPYQTLLITRAQQLPADGSPELLAFIVKCTPVTSFQDLQTILNLPLAQIYRIASHLMYWRVGSLISTITKHNVYVINSAEHLTSSLRKLFAQTFPSLQLVQQMERFSTPKPLQEHLIKSDVDHNVFSDLIVWLLQHHLIKQLCTYLLFCVPRPLGASPPKPAKVPAKPESLADYEQEYVDKLTAEYPKDAKIITAMCECGKGRHRIEEIMWRENQTRDDIFRILKYPSVAKVLHPFLREARERRKKK